MKKVLLLLFIISSIQLNASVFNGKVMSFKQPDGTSVDVKLFGTEYYMRGEGLDGYTVIRDKTTNYICYATLSADNAELVSTGIIYHGQQNNNSSYNTTLGLSKHLDISVKARNKSINKTMLQLGATETYNNFRMGSQSGNQTFTTPINPVSGNIKGLCLVVDFSDEPGTLPMTEFQDFCNDLNYQNFGNNGSLRTFYSDISGGVLDYENEVYGYFRAPLTFADYDAMPYAVGAQQILGLALNWLDAQGFDFTTLSLNPDSSIVAINLMYTGYPPNWAQGMWHHKGNYTSFSADGVHSNDYNCSPGNSPLELAVVAHENGHMIGKWPDTYKYNNITGPDGIGSFDLMCWYGDYNNPTVPNPLFRSNVGWGQVIDVTNYNGLNTDTANSGICYMYRNINDSNEFFLLENRMQTGRSTFIDDEGLTIWHVDRKGDNQTTHHEVYLEHANNNINNHNGACFHAGGNIEFGASTTPSSAFYNGDPSGLRVWDIGTVNNVMTYKLGAGQAGPVLNLSYINLTNDNNANGFIEPAESADVNVNALNTGQLNSSTATLTCTAIGTTASYVTVNTVPVQVGVINVSQAIPATFNITLQPGTPLGTVIKLKFLLDDGTYSIYITKNIIVGVAINMSNQSETTCSAIFYDAGGLSNYNDYSDFTKTFFPVASTQKVKADFSLFDLEDEPNCAYDYLEIYDGPDMTFSPLLGVFCGANSPGIITSTHSSGALTFNFHSDEGVTANGWEAIISCNGPTSINETNASNSFQVYPNPSTGVVFIKTNNEKGDIAVCDMMGREIVKQTLNGENTKLDMRIFSNGIYQVKIKTSGSVFTYKFVLNKKK